MGAGYTVRPKAGGSAEIYIYEDVGEGWFGGVTAKQFAKDLKDLGKVTQIDLRINSAGGDVFDGMAIYRQLMDHPARITAHVDGLAASIASVIAMSADEIRISEAGFIMIHNASGVCLGNAADMRQLADLLDTVSGSIADVYVKRTGQEQTKIKDWMGEEKWFTAAEAVEFGFATSMAENMKLAAHVDGSKHKFKHQPGDLEIAPAPIVLNAEVHPVVVAARPVADAAAAKVARMRALLASRTKGFAPHPAA